MLAFQCFESLDYGLNFYWRVSIFLQDLQPLELDSGSPKLRYFFSGHIFIINLATVNKLSLFFHLCLDPFIYYLYLLNFRCFFFIVKLFFSFRMIFWVLGAYWWCHPCLSKADSSMKNLKICVRSWQLVIEV